MRRGFSLLELIFAIVVIGIIATVAIPKLTNITAKANVSTIKNDINTIVTSVQNYYLLHSKIDKISDSINLNSSTWDISDKEVLFKENDKNCVKITLLDSSLTLDIDHTSGSICQELFDEGMKDSTYNLTN